MGWVELADGDLSSRLHGLGLLLVAFIRSHLLQRLTVIGVTMRPHILSAMANRRYSACYRFRGGFTSLIRSPVLNVLDREAVLELIVLVATSEKSILQHEVSNKLRA